MKRIFLTIILILSFGPLFFISCTDEDSSINSNNILKNNPDTEIMSRKKFHIHFASWDEWGRTSKECKGWGLCNYEDCWFCCTENDVVVSCNDDMKLVNGGEIIVYDETKTGHLIIKLDPTKTDQLEAINNKSVLYLDSDISSAKTTLHKGKYLFNEGIGKHGGYLINASEN